MICSKSRFILNCHKQNLPNRQREHVFVGSYIIFITDLDQVYDLFGFSFLMTACINFVKALIFFVEVTLKDNI